MGDDLDHVMAGATEQTLQYLNDKDARMALLTPWLLPMVVEPRLWDSPFAGGYETYELALVSASFVTRVSGVRLLSPAPSVPR